jgi:hypothetical protein
MSIVYCIDKEKNITYELWKKTLNASDFLQHAERMVADTDWRDHRSLHILDLRGATIGEDITHDTMEDAADYFGIFLHSLTLAKVAIVTTVETKRAEFFIKCLSRFGHTLKVFKSMDHAVKWLGIDAGEAKSAFERLHTFTKEEGRFILSAS